MVKRALEGEDSATAVAPGRPALHRRRGAHADWARARRRAGGRLRLNEAVASQIQKLTRSRHRLPGPDPREEARLAVSSLGPARGRPAAAVPRPCARPVAQTDARSRSTSTGDRHIGVRIPLQERHGRGDRRRARPAQPVRGDGLLPPLPQQPHPRLPGRDGPRARSPRGSPPPRITGAGAEAGVASSSASATAPSPGRSRSRAATRSASSPARSTALLADLREKDQMIGFLRDGHDRDDAGHRHDPGADRAARRRRRRRPGTRRRSRRRPTGRTRLPGPSSPRATCSPTATRSSARSARAAWASSTAPATASSTRSWRSSSCGPRRSPQTRRSSSASSRRSKLARRITHRNVLRTHDFGETGGVPYISMEYVDGVTLKEVVRSRGAPPLGGRPLDRQADVPWARRGPRRRRRPPRHQAAEHADPARDWPS